MMKIFNSGGFTLVEAMVALALLGILAASALLALPKLREVVIKSEQVQVVSNLLNNEMELLRIRSFDELSTLLEVGTPLAAERTINGVTYAVSTQLSAYAVDLYGSDAIQAHVSCEWILPSSGKHTESYWTVFTRYGLSDKKFLN